MASTACSTLHSASSVASGAMAPTFLRITVPVFPRVLSVLFTPL